ncbi:unnamed protein product [Sphagnum troendelagicum]|uniref:Uncharacterized protein n=1 Tax=Sphagnum troendelagicum TaxID=128251 RepID=A0ABP0T9D9_9BRYO
MDMADQLTDYRRIAVKGITALEHVGRFTIRVFVQVESLCKQSMATQGDTTCCYLSVQDACETGCGAACERASQNANSSNAYQDCRQACLLACVRPDVGRFNTTILR